VIIDFRLEGLICILWPPSENGSLINQGKSVSKEKGVKNGEKVLWKVAGFLFWDSRGTKQDSIVWVKVKKTVVMEIREDHCFNETRDFEQV